MGKSVCANDFRVGITRADGAKDALIALQDLCRCGKSCITPLRRLSRLCQPQTPAHMLGFANT
jgi:hypothetical protein